MIEFQGISTTDTTDNGEGETTASQTAEDEDRLGSFQRFFLALPLDMYYGVVSNILFRLNGAKDSYVIVYAMAKIGVYLLNDTISPPSEENWEWNKTINSIGEWFEDQHEFRAAIECYNLLLQNIEVLRRCYCA